MKLWLDAGHGRKLLSCYNLWLFALMAQGRDFVTASQQAAFLCAAAAAQQQQQQQQEAAAPAMTWYAHLDAAFLLLAMPCCIQCFSSSADSTPSGGAQMGLLVWM